MNESKIAEQVARSFKAGEDWTISTDVILLVDKVVQEIKRRGGTLGFIVDNKISVKNFVLDEDHGVPLEIRLYEGSYYPGKVLINAYFGSNHPIPVKDRIPFDAKRVVDAIAKGFMSLVNYKKMARVGGMSYPTMQQVERADLVQLVRWNRYLPSPGENHIDKPNFEQMLDHEAPIMTRIIDRIRELGGITPQASKAVGWERQSDDLGLRPDTADAKVEIGLNEAMDELEYQGRKMWTASSRAYFKGCESVIAEQVVSTGKSSGWIIPNESHPGSLASFNAAKDAEIALEKFNIGYMDDFKGEWGYSRGGSKFF